MRKIAWILLLWNIGFIGFAQNERITEAGLSFNLPNDKWKFVQKQNLDNGKIVYCYKREPIRDKSGRNIIPNISFVIETVNDESLDVITYSGSKRISTPFNVKEVFIHGDKRLKYDNAVAYKGLYTDNYKLEHTMYVIHILNNRKGIQIIMDITSELFDEYDKEFIYSMRSIQNKK